MIKIPGFKTMARIAPNESAKVATDWIIKRLKNISTLIRNRPEKKLQFRNELRNLFPEGLSVSTKNTSDEIEFYINGKASPFNLLMAGNMQLCMASLN